MRYFVYFAVNAALGGLAGFAMGEVAAIYGFTPLFYQCTGLLGGCLAGAAAFI
jgi:hypothetical protein